MLGLLVFLATTVAAAPQVAYEWERNGEEVTWHFSVDQDISNAQLVVNPGADRRVVFAKPVWRSGEGWTVVTRAPVRASRVQIDLTGQVAGRPFNAALRVDLPSVEPFRATLRRSSRTGGKTELEYSCSGSVSEVYVEPVYRSSGHGEPENLEISRSDSSHDIRIAWDEDESLLKMRVVFVGSGGEQWTEEVTTWSLSGELTGLNFATGSTDLSEDGAIKVEAAANRIAGAIAEVGEYVNLKLYVAGYTDTVGSSASNRALSLGRARSVAAALAARGLDVPILVQGYGEDVLAVSTPDQTEQAENRRVLFVLADAPPQNGTDFPWSNWTRAR